MRCITRSTAAFLAASILTTLVTVVAVAVPVAPHAGASVASRIRCSPTTRPCEIPPDLQLKITEISTEIGRRLGRPLPFIPQIAFDTGRGPGRDGSMAAALLLDASARAIENVDGPGAGCLIVFYDRSYVPSEADNTLAHELFHCFQYALDARILPDWFAEGSAEWVGADLAGSMATTRAWWDDWLGRPGRRLFDRTYDALGFFAVLDQQGVDPWSVFDRMQQSVPRLSSQGIYNVANEALGGEEAAVDIAMAVTREPALGTDWESTGPGIPRTRANGVERIRPADGDVTFSAPIAGLYGTASIALRPGGDVLSLAGAEDHATSVGFVGQPALLGRGIAGNWCLLPEGCACPPGSPPRPALLDGAPGPVGVAIARTDDSGAAVEVAARTQTLEEFCAGGPLPVDEALCELITPADAAAALGKPVAGQGSEFRAGPRRTGYCFYPSNAETELSVTGFRGRNAARLFEQLLADANGIAVTNPAVGARAVLIQHGVTGADLYVLTPDGKGVLTLTSDSITTPPNPEPPDWVDIPLGTVLVRLAELAISRL